MLALNKAATAPMQIGRVTVRQVQPVSGYCRHLLKTREV